MRKKKIFIDYTARDFNSIKARLLDHAKRYYPDTFKDMSESSFGSLMTDEVAYIGDILSFYLDYAMNESYIPTALEYDNILKLARPMGYRFKGNPSSYGIASFFIVVPSNIVGMGPDSRYLPVLKKGSEFSTNSGVNFILNEDVDFSDPNNEVVVSSVNDVTGVPSNYAVKAHGQVISGELIRETITVGDYTRFLRLQLSGENICEIVDVFDSEGHSYFEVDFLSQDTVYKPVRNTNTDNVAAPNILKAITVPRRFVHEQYRNVSFLQFGYGSEEDIRTSPIVDPSSVVLNVHGKNYITDESFDPSKLIKSDKFGVVPSNTVLTVISRQNSSEIVNCAVGALTDVVSPIMEFNNITTLNPSTMNDIISSLEVTNSDYILGDVTAPDSDELKRRIFDTFASQNRCVTKQDYIAAAYRMPPSFGAIKRASIEQDTDSFKRNLNLYVISENIDFSLVKTNDTIKNNLKTYLSGLKMVNDTIDILDANIVNIGLEITIVADTQENKYSAMNNAVSVLTDLYKNHFDIGESFSITDVYSELKKVPTIADVVSVNAVHKTGGVYSDTRFDIDQYTSPDGRYIYVPEGIILELKYPNIDIVISST